MAYPNIFGEFEHIETTFTSDDSSVETNDTDDYSDDSDGSGGNDINNSPVYSNIPLDGKISVMENTTDVIDLEATDDKDSEGNGLKYFIVGGQDSHLYTIDQHTGQLSFINPPDFEHPLDSDGNNVYDVIVRVVDSHGAFTDQSLWIHVTDKPDTNEAPDAIDDSATTIEGEKVGVKVLDNDSDPDGDTVFLESFTQASNGTVVRNNNATPGDKSDDKLVYTPDAGFTGTDSFTYTISDGNGGTDTATVTVTVEGNIVNNPPLAVDDYATTIEGQKVGVKVLNNDSDPDGDTVFLESFNQASNGTVVRNNNATPGDKSDDKLVYTPDAGFTGTDSFTYTISDGNGGTDTATVTVTVNDGVVTNPGEEIFNMITGTPNSDQLEGTDGADLIRGLGDADTLRGGAGNDKLVGSLGDDKLFGNEGNDTLNGSNDHAAGANELDILEGGQGADVFVLGNQNGAYYSAGGSNDFAIIQDFESGIDKLRLSGSINDYSLEGNDILRDGDLIASFRGFEATELTSNDIISI
ncbi:MAG: Ig-like domain-containing protein [Xenococcaceae cyanobacterium MO_167.B27]|nr:Ig-like domain-containing protein [Xenococcaceae cyanobacterium MO_167.B27]